MKPLLPWLNAPEWTQLVAALLHSLWQGALLAILLAVFLRRLTRPHLRYYTALGTLGILMLASVVTWAVLTVPKTSAPNAPAAQAAPVVVPDATHALNLDSTDKVVAGGTFVPPTAPIVPWSAWLALAWMLGAFAMLLRAGVKVAGAEKLRRSCQPLSDETMTLLVVEACRALNLARKIRVAVTDQLTSPAVVGVLVPTLILPLSLFTTLTPEQIRFILLHELAHIRRGDYFANLFQLLAEALLFFNPAVWWLSHLIRREREACCDALAIELSGAPAEYARTLVHVAENILEPAPAAALTFGDDGTEPSSLGDRVQRLLVPGYRPSLRLTWRAMLTALFVGGGLLFLCAVGTRITIAAILSPQERMERIEQKMAEYGESLRPESSSAAANAPKVEVSGRVRTADGAPLPKAKWVNIYYSRKNMSGANSARLETNGLFKTQIAAGTLVAAGLDEPGFAPAIAGPVWAEGPNPITNLDLVLESGFDAPILVSDAETGAPIADALIKAQFWAPKVGIGFGGGRELKTDPTGTTAMTKCSTSVELTLIVNASGYEIAEHRAESLKTDEPIRIKLQRGQSLSGMVQAAATATPLAGATVRMIYEKGQKESRYQWTDGARVLAQTDANGRFTISQLRRGTRYWLGISAPGQASALVGPVMAGASDLTVKLGPELIVRGRVLGHLEGLQTINKDYCLSRNYSEVFDNHSNEFQEWVPLQVEGAVVTFQFTNRIPGLVKLTGRNGFNDEREITAPVNDWVVDLTAPENQQPQNLPKREVVFRFKHPSGVPPRGLVQVSVPDNLAPKNLTAHMEDKEITNGEVRVQIAIGGRTQVEPKRTVGYWFKSSDYFVVTNGSGPVVVELPCVAAGAIYAKARNPDGSPAGGLHFGVTELNRAPGRENNGSLDGGGDGFSGDAPRKWVSGPLPLGGTYQIYAWRGNSFCISKAIKLTEANPDAEVELQFGPGQALAGKVLAADGKPVRDAELKMSFTLVNHHGFGLKPVFTDALGTFRVDNVTPGVGEYSAEITAPGWMTERVKLDFKSQPQTIRLKRGRTLAGRVVEAGTGYVIPGMEVRALDFEGHKLPMLTTHTDAEGRFEFTTLGDVTYTLYPDGGQLLGNQKFRADGTTNLTLTVKLYEWSKLKPKPPETTGTSDSAESADDRLEIQTFQIPRVTMVALSGVLSTNPPHAKTGYSTQDNALPDTKLDIVQALGTLIYLCDLNPEKYRGDALSYDEQTGALRVRATRRELDLIEQVIRVLNLNPPQIGRVKFLGQELTADHIQFDHATGDIVARGNARLETTNGTYSGSELRINHASNLISETDYKFTLPEPTIQAPLIPALTEFVGYDLATAATFVPTAITGTNQSSNSALPLPIFRVREVTTSNIVDRSPFLGDLPVVGKLFTSESSRTKENLGPVIATDGDRSFGMNDWTVTGNERLNKQSSWYRGGSTATTNSGTAEPLHERVFEVDLGLFYAAVRKSAGLSETVPETNMFPAIRSYFTNAGVTLDPASGRSLFVSTTRGDIWVRATLPELDAIETLFRPMPGTPLIRRTYHFDSNTLDKVMAVLSPKISSIVATNPAAGFRALLESFNRNDPRPKQVRYLAEREEIHARATAADFEQFESALKGTLRLKPGPIPRPQATATAETNLFTRTFVVGPMELSKALGRTGPMGVTDTAELVAACLAKAGVDLQPPKSVFFKDPLGLLLVRATPAELDALEKFIARANREPGATVPAPLNPARASNAMTPTSSGTNLQTRTYQVDANALVQALERRLGTNVFSGTKPDETKLLPALRQFFATVGVDLDGPKAVYFNGRKGELFVRATLADLEAIETLLAVLNYPSPQVNLKVRWIEVKSPSEAGTLSQGVLSAEQTVDVLQRLKQKDSFTLISEGQITTLSTRQAQFQVAEVKTIVTGIRPAALTAPGIVATNATTASALDAQTMSFGPVLDVIPCVGSDQNQIALHVEAATKEFLGYDKKASQVPIYINGKKRKTTLPLPKYLVRQLTNDCVLRDGQTLVLGSLPAREIARQPNGEIIETNVPITEANPLYVFITATLIDPAGNPTNQDLGVPAKLTPSAP